MSGTEARKGERGLGKHRTEALSDGVFSIAMTLLVLDLKVPLLSPAEAPSRLADSLQDLAPKFAAYALSFLILGICWVGHHNMFHHIKRVDRPALWLNNLFLFAVSMVPFSTALLGEYFRVRTSVMVYGANMLAVGLVMVVIWAYATRGRRLVDSHLTEELVQLQMFRLGRGPLMSLLALVLAIWSSWASLSVFVVFLLSFLRPGRVDRQWRQTDHP